MADVKNDFSYKGAHEANTDFGNLEVGIKLLGYKNINPKENPDDLVTRADKAMYSAKEKGRNRVETAPD